MDDKLLEIDIFKLIFNEKNRHIDDAKVKEYATSISINGLLQEPIVKANGDGTYTVLAGHHRISAYKLLAKNNSVYLKILCKVKDIANLESELVLIDSNLHSPLSPYETVMMIGRKEELFKEMIANGELGCGGAVRDIVAAYTPMLGSTQIGKYLRIYKKAIPEVKEALRKLDITVEQAVRISKQSPEDQLIILYQSKSYEKDVFLKSLENSMQSKLAAKVRLGTNQISINYTSVEDLNRILEIIGCLEEEL